ncbi:MAG: single-stranded DNA-binding protein [Chitinophagales bacterium]|nr:single-stranded DNA-binding protein [Chitinophagales bacterium]
MANNNTVKLVGNIGSEAHIIKTEERTFASFSIATTDSYKDQDDNWLEKDTIWHNLVAFNPKLVEALKAFKKGTRLEVTGSLSYRDFQIEDNGRPITKKEASIVAYKVEQAPLTKKTT